MGGNPVQEPAIVGNDHSTAGEFQQRIFQARECLHVQVVRGLIKKQKVSTLLQSQGEVKAVALTTGEHSSLFLLIGAFEAKA